VPRHLPQHSRSHSADLEALPTRVEHFEEVSRAADREPVGEFEEMLIPGDNHSFLALGEGKQVVVAGMRRAARGRGRIWRENSGALEERDEFGGVLRRYSRSQFRVAERAVEFSQHARRDDELEVASEPTREDPRRRPARGE
jgi:hypothetical protein